LISKYDSCVCEGNYYSDRYLEMAIGNAPWPIGVTMVGIHARTGREKIFSRNVAHVMNDEAQRKYIQGLKRYGCFTLKDYFITFVESNRLDVWMYLNKSRSVFQINDKMSADVSN